MTEPQSAPATDRRTAAEEFAAGLRGLRLDAGRPSFRAMAKQVGAISHTTLHEAASGARLPSWSTVEAFVRACGGDAADWRRRWTQAVGADRQAPQDHGRAVPEAGGEDRPAEVQAAVLVPSCRHTGDASSQEPVSGSRGGRGGSGSGGASPGSGEGCTRGRRLRRLVAAFIAGVLVGAGATLGVVEVVGAGGAAAAGQDCPPSESMPRRGAVPDGARLDGAVPDGARPGGVVLDDAVPVASSEVAPGLAADDPGAAAAPAWIARPASDQEILPGTSVVLPVQSAVTGDDALVLTMMLTSTCPGTVTVTDSQGDRFQAVGDEMDTRHHRVLVFAAFGVRPLTTADSIRVGYPHASKYHIAVDEFRGISAVRSTARSHGESGGTAFTTSAVPVTCSVGDLMIGAVGTNTGTAPEFGTGWTTLPVLKLSSYRLTTAYQTAQTAGPCAATGQTTAQWGAVLAVFH